MVANAAALVQGHEAAQGACLLGAALLDMKAFGAEWISRLEEQQLLLGDFFEITMFKVKVLLHQKIFCLVWIFALPGKENV